MGFILQRKGASFEKICRPATRGEIIFAVTGVVHFEFASLRLCLAKSGSHFRLGCLLDHEHQVLAPFIGC